MRNLKHVLIIATALAFGFQEENHVLVLEDANFPEAVAKFPEILVEFYAPWCGHCQQLAPHYSRAAQTLKEHRVPLAKLDATKHRNTPLKYNIEGFPTLLFFVNGEAQEYTGGRTDTSIVQWVLKKVSPPAKEIRSSEELSSFLEANELAVVLFAQADSPEASVYKEAVKDLEGIYYIIAPDLSDNFGVQEPSLVVFKHYDDKKIVYEGQLTKESIVKFIERQQLPWVLPFEDKAVKYVFAKQNPTLFLFRREKEASKYTQLLHEVAHHMHKDLLITYADLSAPLNRRLAEFLGVSAYNMPMAVITNSSTKYLLDQEITKDSLLNFYRNWKTNSLRPYFKSQSLPRTPYDKNIRVLVANNFQEVVLDRNKDVLVEFYAPWCGHCKKLAPEYEEVAKQLKAVPTVEVAKLDATANEVEGHMVSTFPVIKFFPANNKEGITYEGPRTASGILEFLHKNAAFPLEPNSKEDL